MPPADHAACAALLATGSRSFHAAGRLLPGPARQAATALYAFCRIADDAIDDAPTPAAQAEALASLRTRLDAIYAGHPENFAPDRAFAHTVAAHAIPRALPEALLEGFAWDAAGRLYPDFDALLEYAVRVAGTVGAMMALIMGAGTQDAVARACELGMAMQLSNIARDIGEDAARGRLYLPLDWLEQEGVDPDTFLANPQFNPGLQRCVVRLLAEASLLYAQAAPGISYLPPACRPAIHAARRLYEAIGLAAGADGFNPVTARAHVPGRAKLRLVGRGLLDAALPIQAGPAAIPKAARALVAACADASKTRATRLPLWRRAEARAVWMMELMAQLEQRQQAVR